MVTVAIVALVFALFALALGLVTILRVYDSNQKAAKAREGLATKTDLEGALKQVQDLATKADLEDALKQVQDLATKADLEDVLKQVRSKTTLKRVRDYLDEHYTPDSDLERDFAQLSDLPDMIANAITNLLPSAPIVPAAVASDTSVLERRTERTAKAIKGVVEYLKALHLAQAASLRAPIDEEIAKLEDLVAEDRRGLKPLQAAKKVAEKKVSETKRALLPETASDAEVEKEAEKHAAGLGLPTIKARLQAMAEYEANRSSIAEERKERSEEAKRELEEATTALNEFRSSTASKDAEVRITELRKQLANLDEADKAIANLEKAVGITVVLRRPAPRPLTSSPPSEPPMDVDDAELDPRDSVPDLAALMSSLPPLRSPSA